jgi:hypothetical protein
MDSILTGIFFSTWQEIIMSLKQGSLDAGDAKKFKIPSIYQSQTTNPNLNTYLKLIKMGIANNNTLSSTYVLRLTTGYNFIRVNLHIRANNQLIRTIVLVNIILKQEEYSTKKNKSEEISITTGKNNLFLGTNTNEAKKVIENEVFRFLSEYTYS